MSNEYPLVVLEYWLNVLFCVLASVSMEKIDICLVKFVFMTLRCDEIIITIVF